MRARAFALPEDCRRDWEAKIKGEIRRNLLERCDWVILSLYDRRASGFGKTSEGNACNWKAAEGASSRAGEPCLGP